jgi:hypothetical protein
VADLRTSATRRFTLSRARAEPSPLRLPIATMPTASSRRTSSEVVSTDDEEAARGRRANDPRRRAARRAGSRSTTPRRPRWRPSPPPPRGRARTWCCSAARTQSTCARSTTATSPSSARCWRRTARGGGCTAPSAGSSTPTPRQPGSTGLSSLGAAPTRTATSPRSSRSSTSLAVSTPRGMRARSTPPGITGVESTGGGDGGCEVRRLVSCQPARGWTGALLLLLASRDKGTIGGGLAMWYLVHTKCSTKYLGG